MKRFVVSVLLVILVYLVLGCVFDSVAMVLLTVPLFFPLAIGLGFDPVWFGIFMVIMVECALITPPVGLNLYVIQSVARASLGDVARGVLPFLGLMLVTAVILYIWPDLALYIPFKW